MALLYQEIMKVPGLSGTWQQRNADLYKKLGSPLGPYKGTESQNVFLLNKIRSTNYFASGLPGQQPAQTTAATTPQQKILDQNTQNIRPNTNIYSQDVMTQDRWFDPFDEWTRNYVNTYMKPEWERDTYNPAMKQMTRTLNETNQSMGVSGGWRTTGAQKNLAGMAKDMITEEEKMRQGFQEKSLEARDAIRSNLAVPLYKSNMERWGDSPWGNMNLDGIDMSGIVNNLQSGGISNDYLANLIGGLGSWTPNQNTTPVTRDWSVKPKSAYTPGLFNQYTNRTY